MMTLCSLTISMVLFLLLPKRIQPTKNQNDPKHPLFKNDLIGFISIAAKHNQ